MIDKTKILKNSQNMPSKEYQRNFVSLVVLALIVAGLYNGNTLYYKIAVGILLLSMISVSLFYPFTMFWLRLSEALGSITSKITLTTIYTLLVMPIGMFRKIAGKDSLKTRNFKTSKDSCFKTVDKTYVSNDLKFPF
jgi:hypothetical protein